MKMQPNGSIFNSDVGKIDNEEKVDRIIKDSLNSIFLADQYSKKVYHDDVIIKLNEPIENYVLPFVKDHYTQFKEWVWDFVGGDGINKSKDVFINKLSPKIKKTIDNLSEKQAMKLWQSLQKE